MATNNISGRTFKAVSTITLGLLAMGGWLILGTVDEIVCGVFRFFLAAVITLLSFAVSIVLFI